MSSNSAKPPFGGLNHKHTHMKYIIATTWNGEGYSYQNKAELKEFESDSHAQEYIRQQFNNNESAERYDVIETDGKILFDNGEDQGTWQWIKAEDNAYGVAIMCNINEVEVYDRDGYFALLDDVIADADPDEVEEIESKDNVFLNAYQGEYDYQFLKL